MSSQILHNQFTKEKIINYLITFLPISFIMGNLAINLNIILLIILSLFFFGLKIFQLHLNYLDKLIFFFFIFCLFSYFYNYFPYKINGQIYYNSQILIKTFFFLRFLLLYFVLRFLIEREIIKFKFFFVACFICSLFVSFDLIFQYFVGKNFFGYVSDDPRRLGGPFGNEYIAGSYLQRFSIFSFFLFVCFIKVKKQKNIFLIFIILTLILIFGMLVSGNRIPLIMFLVLFFLSFILLKKMRIFILIFAALSSLIFLLLINTNLNVKQHFGHFNNQLKLFSNFVATILIEEKSSEITEKDYVIKLDNKLVQIPNVWLKEFYYGYKTWKLNTLFGGGIKSFKINCPKTKVLNCPMHPHNYYLEILSDLGLIGFLIIGILIISILYAAFSTKIIFKYNLIIPFVSLLFVEFFPIKTTGSFFTTGNATFNFLIIAIVISIINSKKNKLI